jgi:hypothetical protein
MRSLKVVGLSMIALSGIGMSLGAQHDRKIENLKLRISGHRADQAVADKTIYMFELYCGGGECTLHMFELNNCRNYQGDSAFVPRQFEWETFGVGNLTVTQHGNEVSAVAYQTSGNTTPATFKFVYVTHPDGQQLVKSFSAKQILDVDHFPQELRTFDIVPIIGEKRTYGLDCGVLVDGANE